MLYMLMIYTGEGGGLDHELADLLGLKKNDTVFLEREFESCGTRFYNISLVRSYFMQTMESKAAWFTSKSFKPYSFNSFQVIGVKGDTT